MLSFSVWTALFFLLGLGYREGIALLFATTSVFIFLVWDLLHERKLNSPTLMGEYLVFLGIFFASLWWSFNHEKSLLHWLLFASFPFVWVLASTHREWLKKHFFDLILTLGLLFALMTVLSQTVPYFAFVKTTPRGLVGTYSISADHFMLGDFWAVLVPILVYRYYTLRKTWILPLISLGLAILLFSLSRSALAGLVVSLAVFFERIKVDPIWRKGFWAFVFVAFFYMATQKSILFNRPYYLQALASLPVYPFGVGVANFDLISQDSRFWVFGLSGFSRVTHSIFLEFMVGIGVLVVYFWWWCYRVYREYIFGREVSEYLLALIALVVDFIFNPTYFVTPMWWLFAVLLALLDTSKKTISQRSGGVLALVAVLFLIGGLWTMTV